MVSQERLEGNWNRIFGAVTEKYAQITGDDLQRVRGNAEQLIGMLQQKTGRSREQIEGFLDHCCRSGESAVNRVSESAAEYADLAGRAVRDNYERLSGEAQRGYEYSLRAMQRKPLESVAVALGAGLLAGLVLGISMSSRRR